MNLLLTADTVGGVWTFALELTDALAERDVRVTIAAIGDPLRADQEDELRRSRAQSAHTETFALEWTPDAWADIDRAGEWLLELRDETEPDLVHVSSYSHASLPWGVPVVVTAHSCVLSWFETVRGVDAPAEWDGYRRLVKDGLAAADVIAAPTHAMLAAVERIYDPPGARLVIPNGRRAPAAPAIAKEPFVLSSGRIWDEAKNVAALARIAPALDWPVVLAGEGSSDAASANVMALGRVPRAQLDHLLARASIFALPARYEPFGLGPLEAAQAGCALVLGDIESLREVWGDAATFVAPDDDTALAAALQRLIADDALRLELAGRARRRADAYTPQRMADGYLGAYATAALAARRGVHA
jgi:glycogen synthase